ncbi:MAG: hypothetical protein MZV70_13605 [Desulfobacterales bacterium]|nr:hypothetical protein [Desulfobacterales bacterium]
MLNCSVLLLFFLPYLDRGQRGRLKVIVAGMLLLILHRRPDFAEHLFGMITPNGR